MYNDYQYTIAFAGFSAEVVIILGIFLAVFMLSTVVLLVVVIALQHCKFEHNV